MILPATALNPEATSQPCPNCGAAFADPRPKFCGACGQESNLRAPTLLEFLQQFGGAYISTEGALWRTLWRLLLLPGQLTLEYLAGRRRRYVLPLRLYLTISVLALLSLRLVTSGKIEANVPEINSSSSSKAIQLEDGDTKNIQIGGLWGFKAGLKDGVFYCTKFPASMCKRLERRLTLDHAGMAKEMVQLSERALNNVGTTMFVLLPCFALWLKLIFWDKRMRYTEHLTFALHLHAFWFAMVMLLLIQWEPLSALAGIATVIYPVIALHRVYRCRWWSTLPRAFALFVLNLSSVSLVFATFALMTLVS
ncbi:DUF3667 domain-containing protein [Roseateles oligotrophus]|uniref:DUF3667 domain-containing protein n=1 Tax=Roseateles oligotrophus TaxID=1769250 RepID=A0ABT2YJP5_9BURK|nr:DUF3667 domain-containing protein [Roseateles oligotrophus]MCV2370186.1 DUF3667 domain-containing protein [Roseateles oligotrophus]